MGDSWRIHYTLRRNWQRDLRKITRLAVEMPLSEISRHRHEALDLEVNFHIKFSCNYVSGETVQSLCKDSSFEKKKTVTVFHGKHSTCIQIVFWIQKWYILNKNIFSQNSYQSSLALGNFFEKCQINFLKLHYWYKRSNCTCAN